MRTSSLAGVYLLALAISSGHALEGDQVPKKTIIDHHRGTFDRHRHHERRAKNSIFNISVVMNPNDTKPCNVIVDGKVVGMHTHNHKHRLREDVFAPTMRRYFGTQSDKAFCPPDFDLAGGTCGSTGGFPVQHIQGKEKKTLWDCYQGDADDFDGSPDLLAFSTNGIGNNENKPVNLLEEESKEDGDTDDRGDGKNKSDEIQADKAATPSNSSINRPPHKRKHNRKRLNIRRGGISSKTATAVCTPKNMGLKAQLFHGKTNILLCRKQAGERMQLVSGGCAMPEEESDGKFFAINSPLEIGRDQLKCREGEIASGLCAPKGENYRLLDPVIVTSSKRSVGAMCNTSEAINNAGTQKVYVLSGYCIDGQDPNGGIAVDAKGALRSNPSRDPPGWFCTRPFASQKNNSKITAVAICAVVKIPPLSEDEKRGAIPAEQRVVQFDVRPPISKVPVVNATDTNAVKEIVDSLAYLQRPAVYSQDNRIVNARLESWDEEATNLPKSFSIVTTCNKPGLAFIDVVLHLADGSIGKNVSIFERKRFRLRKLCEGPQTPPVRKIKSLSIGLTKSGSEVMEKGEVKVGFAVKEKETTSNDGRLIVKPDQAFITFFIKSSQPLPVNFIAASSGNPNISVNPMLFGGMPNLKRNQRFGSMTPSALIGDNENMGVVTLKLDCLAKAESTVSVLLRTRRGPASFEFIKHCDKEMIPEGFPVEGLMITTDPAVFKANATEDNTDKLVVKDGIIMDKFKVTNLENRVPDEGKKPDAENDSSSSSPSPSPKSIVYGKDAESATFVIKMTNDLFTIGLQQPYVIEEPAEGVKEITSPVIIGNVMDMTTLDSKSEAEMTIDFHCHRAGVTTITVILPIDGRSRGNRKLLRWQFQKVCKEVAQGTSRPSTEIPGLYVKLAKANVIKNGIVHPRFRWAGNDTSLDKMVTVPEHIEGVNFQVTYNTSNHNLNPERSVRDVQNGNSVGNIAGATNYLQRRISISNAVKAVAISDKPEIVQANAMVSGFHGLSNIFLQLQCERSGSSIVTVALHLPPRIEKDNVRLQEVKDTDDNDGNKNENNISTNEKNGTETSAAEANVPEMKEKNANASASVVGENITSSSKSEKRPHSVTAVFHIRKMCVVASNDAVVEEKGGVLVKGLRIEIIEDNNDGNDDKDKAKDGDQNQGEKKNDDGADESSNEAKTTVVVENGFPKKQYFGQAKKAKGTQMWQDIVIGRAVTSTAFTVSFDPPAYETVDECADLECSEAESALCEDADDAGDCPCMKRCQEWVNSEGSPASNTNTDDNDDEEEGDENEEDEDDEDTPGFFSSIFGSSSKNDGESTGAGESLEGSFVKLDPPMIFPHDRVSNPRIIGDLASSGSSLVAGKNGTNVTEFTIEWNCRFRGETVVTVKIPVVGRGFIGFTIPKACDGNVTKQNAGILVHGLMVSTKKPKMPRLIGQVDVARNGKTMKWYMPHTWKKFPEYRKVATGEEKNTTFYIWRNTLTTPGFLKGRKMKINLKRNPIVGVYVMTHRPICNPRIAHDIPIRLPRKKTIDDMTRNTTKKGKVVSPVLEAQRSKEEIELDERIANPRYPFTLNVSYNCVWDGSTTVTVILMIRGGGTIPFTFTKICARDSVSLAPIRHCMEYKAVDLDDNEEDVDDSTALANEAVDKDADTVQNNTKSDTDADTDQDNTNSDTDADIDQSSNSDDDEPDVVLHKCAVCEPGFSLVQTSELLNVSDDCVYNETLDNEFLNGDDADNFGDDAEDNFDPEDLFDDDMDGNDEFDANLGVDEEVGAAKEDFAHEPGAWDETADIDNDDDEEDVFEMPASIDVATTPRCPEETSKCDVVRGGIQDDKFSMLEGDNTFIVRPKDKSTVFYVSVPEQDLSSGVEFTHPAVTCRPMDNTKSTKNICMPNVGGSGARGYLLNSTTPLTELSITYNCKNPGVAAVLVSIPMAKPYGKTISFSFAKICGNFKEDIETTVTAPFIMYSIFTLAFIGAAIVCYFLHKGLKGVYNRYIRVPTTASLP